MLVNPKHLKMGDVIIRGDSRIRLISVDGVKWDGLDLGIGEIVSGSFTGELVKKLVSIEDQWISILKTGRNGPIDKISVLCPGCGEHVRVWDSYRSYQDDLYYCEVCTRLKRRQV